jgi:hypothetical protein
VRPPIGKGRLQVTFKRSPDPAVSKILPAGSTRASREPPARSLNLPPTGLELDAGAGTDLLDRHFSAMASVVTIAELRELRQLKAMLPEAIAAARGFSNYGDDRMREGKFLERKIARDRLRGILTRMQEIENKYGVH